MISFFEALISSLSVHKIGNKLTEDKLFLSEHPVNVKDEILSGLLMKFFLEPFQNTAQFYQFYHPSDDLNLNEVYHFCRQIFDAEKTFHKNSKQFAKYLYDISSYPNIKGGELYVVYFKDILVDGELADVVGLFKSESKEPYLTIKQNRSDFNLDYEEHAINIKKLDKGCLIFNIGSDEGFKVAVVDQTNRTEAVYWTDHFLKLKVKDDSYSRTNETLNFYKHFVTEKLEQSLSLTKTDKIDLLNRSISYFKSKESFDANEFADEVIGDPEGIRVFNKYKKDYNKEFDANLGQTFNISAAAVKKQARQF